MSALIRILVGLAAAAICAPACAQDSFRVSILVLSERSPIDAPADFPTSPQTRVLAPVGQTRRFVHAGSLDAAQRFYGVELEKQGYRLMRTGVDGGTWERNGIVTELQFDPVVGAQHETTLIRLTVSGRKPAFAAVH